MKYIVGRTVGYRKTKGPNELDSGGLGPCIAVGAVYGNTRYMSHDAAPDENTDGLDRLLKALAKDVKDKSGLRIAVGGGSFMPALSQDVDAVNESIQTGRSVVLDKIRQAGYGDNIVQVKWGKPHIALGMSLKPAEKEPVFDETPRDENGG